MIALGFGCSARALPVDAAADAAFDAARADAAADARAPDTAPPTCAALRLLRSRVIATKTGPPRPAIVSRGFGVLYTDAQQRLQHATLDPETLGTLSTEGGAFTALGAYAYGNSFTTGLACWGDPTLMAVQITSGGMQLPQTMQTQGACEQVRNATWVLEPRDLILAALVSRARGAGEPSGVDYAVRRIRIAQDLARPEPATPTVYTYPQARSLRISASDGATDLARPPRPGEPKDTLVLDRLDPRGVETEATTIPLQGALQAFDLIGDGVPTLVYSARVGVATRILRWSRPDYQVPAGTTALLATEREAIGELRAFFLRGTLRLAWIEAVPQSSPRLHVASVLGDRIAHLLEIELPGAATGPEDLEVVSDRSGRALLTWRQRARAELAAALLGCE